MLNFPTQRSIIRPSMKNLLILPVILACFAFLTLPGCQSKEELPTREKTLSQGFKMMDEERYGDAISYFSELVKVDNHYHVKMALASAYAGRAGIKIKEIYSFVIVKDIALPEINITGLSLDKQTKETMKSLARLSEQWNRIPDTKAMGRLDLQSALDALEGDQQPGLRLYAATLRIVLLKSSIQEGVKNFEVLSAKKLCSKELRPYMKWAGRILESLSYLALDLEASFPEQKTNYEEARINLNIMKTQLVTLKWPEGDQCL